MNPADVRAAQRFARTLPAQHRADAEAAYAWARYRNLTISELAGMTVEQYARIRLDAIPQFVLATIAAVPQTSIGRPQHPAEPREDTLPA